MTTIFLFDWTTEPETSCLEKSARGVLISP